MFDGSSRTEANQIVSNTRNGARLIGDSPKRFSLRTKKDEWRGPDDLGGGISVDAELSFEELRKLVAPLRERLLTHPIYAEVNSLNRLREFMRIHVFAVWDFMSLVKRLQGELTVQDLPWMPPARPEIARFANEVVLGEETDLSLDGKPLSHFELYLRAMGEVGAETDDVRASIASVGWGASWEAALRDLNAPKMVTDFVSETLRCAIYGSVVEVASYFFFGREDVIPEMFKKLLALWREGAVEVPYFAFYLERHIELDGDSHGPWARQMLTALAGTDETKWIEATRAAQQALSNRIKLWDGVVAHLKDID
jgi:Protein of unknown function (DUF3050)